MRRWATLLLLLLPATAQEGGGLDGPSGPPEDSPKEPEKEAPPELPVDEGCGEEEAPAVAILL